MVEATLDGDRRLAGAILDQIQPESPDNTVATVASCIDIALGLLDQWLSGHDPNTQQEHGEGRAAQRCGAEVPAGVASSVVDEVEPRIRELLQAWPTMPSTVIAERIGWSRSIRVLSDRVAELRPVYLPPDPAGRTQYVAGEIGQCDLCSRRSRCRSSSGRPAVRRSCRC